MVRILVLRVLSVEGKMSNTHAGKVAIVTGSARGIGAAIASQLASESAKVLVNYNTGKAAAEDVVAAILRDGGKALAVQADVRTAVGAERLFTVAEADEVIGEEHRAATRVSISGTHLGPLMGLPASGKYITLSLNEFRTFREGRISVTRHMEDWMGLFRQIGALPSCL